MHKVLRAGAAAVVAAACAAVCGVAHALPEGDVVGVHLVSAHIPADDYNNVNPGIYYRLAEGPVAGVYRNSLRRTSAYVGYTFQYKIFDLTVGGVTGYKNGAQPLLVPSVALYTHSHYTARLVFIPQVEKRIGSHVLHLVVEYK